MKTVPMRLLTADEYYKTLVRVIPNAKKRVIIEAMIVLWDGRTLDVAPLLEAALHRGVKVGIVGDVYSRFESKTAGIAQRGPHFDWPKTTKTNERLSAAGADVYYFGHLGLNPFGGRSHTKITIVDDIVYTFGGVNFTDSHLKHHDLMLERQDAALADQLEHLVQEIKKDQVLPDITQKLDDSTTLLFDGGTPGGSAIYQAACDIVATAKKVHLVSKMCPSGRLARLLNRTDSQLFFNRPELEGLPANLAIIWDQRRFGIKNQYKGSQHIHAKFILAEEADGTRHVISGSNNFSWRGIAYGTKEIAMHSTSSDLYDQFYAFMRQRIAAQD
ncbi:MAG TPA: phospholipase D-like domain-containing protein [Candidatus Saccharimonadales bacterium]